MQTFRGVGIFVAIVIGLQTPAHAQDIPTSRRESVVETIHGVAVTDPYRWLEALDSPEVQAWATAQNAAAEHFAGSGVDERTARIRRYSDLLTTRQLRTAAGRTFFLRGWSGAPYEELFIGDPDGDARRLDGNVIAPAPGATPERVFRYWPSPNGRFVLALTAPHDDRWGELRLIETASGTIVSRRTANLTGTGAAWLPDSASFVYSAYDRDADAPVRGRIVRVSLSGGEQDIFAPIADGANRHRLLTPFAAPDRPRVFVDAASGTSGDSDLYLIDLTRDAGSPRRLTTSDGLWSYVGARGDSVWLYTNTDAPNGRVVRLDAVSGALRMRTVIPEGRGSISAGSRVGGNAIGMFGDRIALLYQEDAAPIMRVFDLNGRRTAELPISATGSIWNGFEGDPRRAELYYQFLGASEPSTIYRVDLHNGRRTRVTAADGVVASDDIVAQRIFVDRPDGARVPIIIAHRRGLSFDQPRPLIMYGYGAFGWVSFLWYQPHVVDFLLHDDGVFVVAGVRGGGEFGAAWAEAGRGQHRQTAIDDYIAVAEHLIATNYTTSDLLVANGGSISGGLAGAAVNQRPDLFGAAMLDYPALDLIRYPAFGHARYWTDELGSPDDPNEFATLLRLSPYHNIDDAACPRPTLVRIGPEDETVTPIHGFKYVARLQNVGRSCSAPVYLDLMEGAGHDYGAEPAQIARSHAVALEFLSHVLPAN